MEVIIGCKDIFNYFYEQYFLEIRTFAFIQNHLELLYVVSCVNILIIFNTVYKNLLKGPHKWTFLETCLLHVFYQFLYADYEYKIFRMLKKCSDDFLEG